MLNQVNEIDAALVKRLIRTQFPQWAELAAVPVESGGWDSRTFHLGDRMSVRLPSAPTYVAQVAKEHRWLPVLQPHLSYQFQLSLALGLLVRAVVDLWFAGRGRAWAACTERVRRYLSTLLLTAAPFCTWRYADALPTNA